MPKLLVSLAVSLVLVSGAATLAQAPAGGQMAGTISGRITSNEKGVAGIGVMLLAGDYGPRRKAFARATTDAEGHYRLTNLPPGRYQLLPLAPAFYFTDLSGWLPGKPVTLAAGETVEGVDFNLARGVVITGRVTDADGKPVIGERVQIAAVEGSPASMRALGYSPANETDDRGVYRAYGLAAGRYRVSVGQDRDGGYVRMGGPAGYYTRTFYPGTTEESEARVVEVSAGGEATDIDITLGRRTKTYKAAGRIVSADTGQPVPNITFAYGAIIREENRMGAFGMGLMSNARGEFTIEGVAPGRYGVFATSRDQADWYSDVVRFEIIDADVAGLEVRIHRGATISGSVVIEGLSDRAAMARLLPQVSLFAYGTERAEAMSAPRFAPSRVAPDGSFRISGLRPGRVDINVAGWPSPLRGISLARIEREGVEVQGTRLEVGEGAQLTGVRVVLAYGAGAVRGQVVIKNGEQPGVLPQGTRLLVYAHRVGGPQLSRRPNEVDARGIFLLEDLPAGDYEITLRSTGPLRVAPPKQLVSVPAVGEVPVTLTLDLSATGDRGGRP